MNGLRRLLRLLRRYLGFDYSPSKEFYEAWRASWARLPNLMQEEKARLKEQRERHKQEVP